MWLLRRLLLVIALGAGGGAAQEQGTIRGTVYGGSGIVIPNPLVKVTNLATRVANVGTAEYGGKFVVKELPPGRYIVSSASLDSFPEITVELRSGETANAD